MEGDLSQRNFRGFRAGPKTEVPQSQLNGLAIRHDRWVRAHWAVRAARAPAIALSDKAIPGVSQPQLPVLGL